MEDRAPVEGIVVVRSMCIALFHDDQWISWAEIAVGDPTSFQLGTTGALRSIRLANGVLSTLPCYTTRSMFIDNICEEW